MGIEAALIGIGSAIWGGLGGTVAAAGASAVGASVIGAGTAAAIGGVTLGLAGAGIGMGIGAIANSGKGPSSYSSTPSADTTSSTTKALTVSQLQAGNSNVSNTMGGYTSNTLNTARGRLLNI